jgi:ribosomal-protein-serine acetyltransferase
MFDYVMGDELKMRIIEKRHAQEFYDLIDGNREHFGRWLTWIHGIEAVVDADGFIQRYLNKYADSNGILVGLWHMNTLVGAILIREIDHSVKCSEIGYFIDERCQGRGWATRMCQAMITYVFEELGMNKVLVQCTSGNDRSISLPKRLNFRHEGTIRQSYNLNSEYVDVHIYGLLKSEYKGRAPSAS